MIIQGLIELALVEKPLFRLEQPREYDSNRFSVGPIETEYPHSIGRHAKVERTGLHGKAGGIRQEPDRERILERFFNILDAQGDIEIEWRIVPIKFHNDALLYVHRPCNVLTMYLRGNRPLCQQENQSFLTKKSGCWEISSLACPSPVAPAFEPAGSQCVVTLVGGLG